MLISSERPCICILECRFCLFLWFFDLIFSLFRQVVFFLSISSAISLSVTGPTWSCSYGSWIYNYPSNQCLSPLTLEFEPRSWRGVIDTTLCNAVCQCLAAGLWMTASIWACLQLSKLKYLYHTPIQLVGTDKHINFSKLQWSCFGIKIQLHIYIQKVYRKMIKKNVRWKMGRPHVTLKLWRDWWC